jgi:hypothetical protein
VDFRDPCVQARDIGKALFDDPVDDELRPHAFRFRDGVGRVHHVAQR